MWKLPVVSVAPNTNFPFWKRGRREGEGRKRKEEWDLHMLTPQRNTSLPITCSDDAIHKARKRWDTTDEEGGNGAPVAGVAGVVTVYAVEVVHVGDGDVAAADNVVIGDQDGCHGT